MVHEEDPGRELVLDNRKLIIVFGLLIGICCCAFVLGFIEGKRQGIQHGNQAAGESLQKGMPESAPAPPAGAVQENAETTAPKPDLASPQLDWYQNVSGPGGTRETTATPAEPKHATPAASAPAKPDSAEQSRPSAEPAVTYSVQVGAFKQKSQLDARAKTLRQKGFQVWTEEPEAPDNLYLLKVGKFRSRPEAVAMQLRLKRAGISSFIKTN
jgi:cell division septation protein DedD